MRIPDGPNGQPTLSTNQFRTYGGGGFNLDEHEQPKGCPRLYKAQYVDRIVPDERSYALDYGSFFHDVLFRMEEDGLTPDEALLAAFPTNGTPEMMSEAKADLAKYLERGASPVDRFSTLAVETELEALLYVDEDFGPTYFRGFIDWLGLDPDDAQTVRVVDYKTNRFPPKAEDVAGDVQLKGYDWLVTQNAEKWGINPSMLDVIVHLDAVKWREVEVRFSRSEIADWEDWAVAVARAIWRDEEAKPKVNPGCDYCPIKADCPAYANLPANAQKMADAVEGITTDEGRLRWRDAANRVRLLLEKGVKRIDAEFKTKAMSDGILVVGNQQWVREDEWSDLYDLRALHRAMGNDFYDVITAGKGKIAEVTKDYTPSQLAAVQSATQRVQTGMTVKRSKRQEETADE